MDKKRNINRMIKIMIIGIIILMIAIFSLNIYVVNNTKNEIVKEENVSNIEGVDCILILGAGIWGDKPSPMLEDRLKEGIVLYKQGTTKKIIMSGDHSREDYDEVKIMKEYAENKDRIMNEISKLSEEKKEDFIEYLLQYTLKK